MTENIKTIDNLGINAYTRFDTDHDLYDKKYIEESNQIVSKIRTDISKPMLISEYQLLFGVTSKEVTWAMMPPPNKYNEQTGRLFTNQLTPKCGPEEVIDMIINRISGQRDQEIAKINNGLEKEQIATKANKLISLMNDINVFNKMLEKINAERLMYVKG